MTISASALTSRISRSLGVLFALAVAPALPQSLDAQHPAPLQPGVNTGTVDNFVGSNFFKFSGGPGALAVAVSYNSMRLLGSGPRLPSSSPMKKRAGWNAE